jgi:hypothetical protein
MITDRIQLAGLESYFRGPTTQVLNLGPIATVTIRTAPLNKGKQLEISGIQLLIEHADLQPLFAFQFDVQNPAQPAPLFKISVMKEMFAGLFADPFSHRVHNIAGYLDFNEGTLTNGRVMEVDGVPTICSTGKEELVWISKEYVMPDPISIAAIAWELATAKLTPPDSFHYKIEIALKRSDGTTLTIFINNRVNSNNNDTTQDGSMLKADAKRAIEILNYDALNYKDINSFQITFTAKVFEDSYLRERSLPLINENLGRPLLRAINILEPVKSTYQFNSLTELQNHCSDFHFFENPGTAIPRLTATLDLSATLVNSPNQWIHPDNNLLNRNIDIYNIASKYEYIELALLTNQFTRFEAKKIGDILIRI